MATKKPKLLIDSSSVRAVLGDSTKDHVKHVRGQIAGGRLFSSTYLRMEFIRRWFCDAARMAFTIDQFRDVSDALIYLEQDFSPRKIKGYMAVLAKYLNTAGQMNNTRAAAEELASIAIAWLRLFDQVFPSRIPNTCRCQIGSKSPEIDYNRLLADLRAFYEAFLSPVTDCEVNDFLQLQNPRARALLLLADPKSSSLSVVQNLSVLRDSGTHITCRECSRVGDVVIALEQPASWILVHLDHSFNELCRVLDRDHKQIKSIPQITKETAIAREQDSSSAELIPPHKDP